MNQLQDRSPLPRIAVISAAWHPDIVARAREAFVDEMARHDWPPDRVDRFAVPGAFEIPLKAQTLARAGGHAAIVAIALVVDGGIYRHDFVAAAVIDGLMRVQLDEGLPVFSVVLTPHAFHAHEDHRRFFGDHFEKKGHEAAQAALAFLREAPATERSARR
jgi:6,7-dimethyl-8-ribityllumazine synthase